MVFLLLTGRCYEAETEVIFVSCGPLLNVKSRCLQSLL